MFKMGRLANGQNLNQGTCHDALNDIVRPNAVTFDNDKLT
jgi:hypothetical protein